jgi:hypothetical protein
MKAIQSFVNCDVPPFRDLEYDVGSGWTSFQLSGWHVFSDYLDKISGELPNGWILSYNTSRDKVRLTSGSGSISLRFNQSTADLLGSSSLTVSTSSSLTFGLAPMGLCPIQHLHISDPVTGNKPNLRGFRHGRSFSTSFGDSISYQVETRFDSEDVDRVQNGPLSVGKLRFGDLTASSAYGSGNLGGYLDGFIVNQDSLSLENEEVQIGARRQIKLVVPNEAHNSSEALSHSFWGNIERGFSLNYFATVEGVPFRFVEKDVGFSSGDYTDSFSLIVDDSQAAHYKIDRFKGLAAASGLTVGILDPDNALGLFSRATVEIPIDSDVAYNSTTIDLSGDSSGFPSSGVVYLGKEALQYTGNTGPGGSPANQLQGVSRPFGLGYSYGNKSTEKFRTVCNRKRVWDGCEVNFRAMLLDPFGRAVGTSYSDDYQIKIFSGEVDGVPGYDSGVWVIQCRDLLRRLTKKLGETGIGQTSPSAPQSYQGLTGVAFKDASFTWVRSGSESLVFTVTANDGSNDTTITQDRTMTQLGLSGFHTLYEGFEAILKHVNSMQFTGLTYTSGYVYEQIEIVHDSSEYAINSDGTISVGYFMAPTSQPDYIIKQVKVAAPNGGYPPPWLPLGFTFFDQESDSSDLTSLFRKPVLGFTGQTCPHIVIKQPPNSSSSLGEWTSSGFALLEGDNNFSELIRFESISTGIPNAIVLEFCTRNLLGQPTNYFQGKREIKQAQRPGTEAEAQAETIGSAACKILESSGNTSSRGSFDVYPAGIGYGLDASEHIFDLDLTNPRFDLQISPALNVQADLVLTGGPSFEDLFCGTAAALGLCFSWVRVDDGLKIGVVGTRAQGSEEEFTITDSDLVAGSSVDIVKVAAGPNEVTVSQDQSPYVSGKTQYTYRIIEDILARGVVSQKINLYGMQESAFFVFAKNIAAGLVNYSSSDTAYRLKVKPSRDYLAGQLVRVDISHPGLWDWKANSYGLSDTARITEVKRSLSSGECEITILTGATVYYPALCPVAFVTSYNGSGSNAIVTLSNSAIFKDGEVLRLYNPGLGIADEKTILSINYSTNQVTVSGLYGFTPTNNFTVATFPLDSNANASPRQLAHAHTNDGGSFV